MVWSTGADDAKILLDIHFLMIQVITDQLAFSLVDICLGNILRYYVIRYYALQKLRRLTTTKKLPSLACKMLYVQVKNGM